MTIKLSQNATRFMLFMLSSFLIWQKTRIYAFQSPMHWKGSIIAMKSSSNNEDHGEVHGVKTRNPFRLLVLRYGFTEPAWTSPLNYQKKEGALCCAYCGQELFDAASKYDSGSGWPSFWRSAEEGALSYKMEFDGRLECQCGRCKSHLGHVFMDGPREADVPQELLRSSPASDPRGQSGNARLPRFCINGASLRVKESAAKNT